jgi:hypothetical protein
LLEIKKVIISITRNITTRKIRSQPLLLTLGIKPQKINTTLEKTIGIMKIYMSISIIRKIRNTNGIVALNTTKTIIGIKIKELNLALIDKIVIPSGNH